MSNLTYSKSIKDSEFKKLSTDQNHNNTTHNFEETSIDQIKYYDETRNREESHSLKRFRNIVEKQKFGNPKNKAFTEEKEASWMNLYSKLFKNCFSKKEFSMKEIELRLTSVFGDLENITNPKARLKKEAELKQEKKKFIPSLINRYNKYDFKNYHHDDKKTQTTNNFYFKSFKSTKIINAPVIRIRTATKKHTTKEFGINNISNTVSPINAKEKTKFDFSKSNMNLSLTPHLQPKKNLSEIVLKAANLNDTKFITNIISQAVTHDIQENLRKKPKNFDHEREVVKYFKHQNLIPLEHFFHFDKIVEDIEVAKTLRRFTQRGKIMEFNELTSKIINELIDKDKLDP